MPSRVRQFAIRWAGQIFSNGFIIYLSSVESSCTKYRRAPKETGSHLMQFSCYLLATICQVSWIWLVFLRGEFMPSSSSPSPFDCRYKYFIPLPTTLWHYLFSNRNLFFASKRTECKENIWMNFKQTVGNTINQKSKRKFIVFFYFSRQVS